MAFSAEYELAWHELDQPIKVGEVSTLYFDRDAVPLRFYDARLGDVPILERRCVIDAIDHPDLGQVAEIDTNGLDYTITLANGTAFLVEAEESPGYVYEFPIRPKRWVFTVKARVVDEIT